MKTRIFSSGCLLLAGFFVGTLSAAGFTPIRGTYSGLFYETNGDWQQSSGVITITTTDSGKYSAKLQIGLDRYSFSGRLGPAGNASREILRHFQNPLLVEFQVDAEDRDLIFGSVSDGTWTADLIADRAVYDGKTAISPDAGKYTMAILGDFTSTDTPGGAGCGTITIDKAARIRFIGSLADGSRLMLAARVSKGGQWPLYAPAYRGWGSLYAWILFNGSADEDLSGDVTWIRPEMRETWYYPQGFAVLETAIGSWYAPPPRAGKVLDVTDAAIEFNGGNLERGITNHIVLGSGNRIQNLSPNGLRLSFSLSTGSLTGNVMDPITWERIPFRGVVLQRQALAAGYFLGWDQSGEVWLQGE